MIKGLEEKIKEGYEEFLAVAQENKFEENIDFISGDRWYSYYADRFNSYGETKNPIERLYLTALRILRPYLRTLKSINDIKPIMKIQKESLSSGIYFSAIFNISNQNELVGNFVYDIFGYRPPHKKKLVILPRSILSGSVITQLGMLSRGIIINYGNVHETIGSAIRGGVQINFGRSRIIYAGRKGIRINFGEYYEEIQRAYDDSILLNFGHCREGWEPRDFNFGLFSFEDLLKIKLKSLIEKYQISNEKAKDLEKKIYEVEGMKPRWDGYADTQKVLSYDREDFEREFLSLKKKNETQHK